MSAGAIFFGSAAVAALLGVALLVWALFADRSRGRKRCPKCWYDMSAAVNLRCPECGREVKHEKQLLKTRRRWKAAFATLLPFALAGFLALQPKVQRDGWWSVMPTTVMLLQFHTGSDDALREAINLRMRRDRDGTLLVHPDALYQWQWAWLGRRSLTLLDDDEVSRDERLRYIKFAWAAKVSLADHPLDEELDQALARHLHHSDAAVRLRALQLCHHRDFDVWLGRLAHLVTDDDPEVRRNVVLSIGGLIEFNERALKLIIEALGDEDERVQSYACLALWSFAKAGGRSPDAVRALQEAVARTAGVRNSAHFSFVATLPAFLDGSERLLFLHQSLASSDGTTQYAARHAIESLWPDRADFVELVIHTFDDPDACAESVAAAAWLLSNMANPEPLRTHESALRRLEHHHDAPVRRAAAVALSRIAGENDAPP